MAIYTCDQCGHISYNHQDSIKHYNRYHSPRAIKIANTINNIKTISERLTLIQKIRNNDGN